MFQITQLLILDNNNLDKWKMQFCKVIQTYPQNLKTGCVNLGSTDWSAVTDNESFPSLRMNSDTQFFVELL